MTCHAMLCCGVPRNVFCIPLEFPTLHSSSFTYFAIQRSSGNRSNSAISAIPSFVLQQGLLSFSLHPLSVSPRLAQSSFLSLSLSSLSNFSFSLPRRNSRFPALSKINTSQRGLKTCVNMVLHCLYVHITLSAPGYYHTEPRRPLRRPFRLFIPRRCR